MHIERSDVQRQRQHRDLSMTPRTAILATVLALTGCSSTFGPYLADIKYAPDGSMVVTKCTQKYTAIYGFESFAAPRCEDTAAGKRTFLHVKETNLRAQAVYERLGFVVERRAALWPVTRVE